MAGILKVDRVQSDSNLAINIAGSNVAFFAANTLLMGGNTIISGNKIASTGMPVGSVLQVISANKVDGFTTTSLTAVDITGLSVSITPTSTSSKILVLAHIYGGGENTTAIYLNLVRNSTTLSIGTAGTAPLNSTIGAYLGASTLYTTMPIMFLDSPATTSSTTYKIQAYSGTGSVAVNRRVSDSVVGGSSSITVMEIAG
jgi:hypothetical protein